MQADTIRCSNCDSQVLQKCIMIHERACYKKIIQHKVDKFQKPEKGFFSQLYLPKKQQKWQQDLIPCTQCGESVSFSIFAMHQEQCIGHQLMECDQCRIRFPIFLFDQHLQLCTGPKYQPPLKNGLFNIYKPPQPKMNIQSYNEGYKLPEFVNPLFPLKVQKMVPQVEQSDDEELVEMIGALARREIQNARLSEEPLTRDQLKKLHEFKLKSGEECSICCVEMDKKKSHIKLNCAHTFHKKCIFSWLAKNPLCPMCRQHALKQ